MSWPCVHTALSCCRNNLICRKCCCVVCFRAVGNWGKRGLILHPLILLDHLPLFQPGGGQIMPIYYYLPPPQDFQIFLVPTALENSRKCDDKGAMHTLRKYACLL